jgi:ribose transport system substrate-binding protein
LELFFAALRSKNNHITRRVFMKKVICLVLVLAMIASLAACAAPATQAAGSGDAAAASVAGRTVKDAYKDNLKIAFLPDNIGDTVGAAWGVGIKNELAYFPNVTYNAIDGKSSSENQVAVMEDLINQKYDGIILQAHDSASLADVVEKAEAAGIPVVDLNLDAATHHAGLVAMVAYEAGQIIADQIAKECNNKGNVVIIEATLGASRGEQLQAGFKDQLTAKYPDMKILDSQTGEWVTEKANAVMNTYLSKYPQIDAVFCHNDAMAEGASAAAEAAGRLDKMFIWGADGEKKALDYIANGKMAGTIYTNCFEQGATAARLIMYLINSEANFAAYTKTPVIKMAPIVATKETLDQIPDSIRW